MISSLTCAHDKNDRRKEHIRKGGENRFVDGAISSVSYRSTVGPTTQQKEYESRVDIEQVG
jgi:hypothetical protein